MNFQFSGNKEAIQYIIDIGSDIDVFNYNADAKLYDAVEKGNSTSQKIISTRIKFGHSYCLGHMETIRYLVEHGANVNYTTYWGLTLLNNAILKSTLTLKNEKYCI